MLGFTPIAKSQNLYFPPLLGSTWEQTSASSLGYSQQRIDSLYAFLETNNSKGFLLLQDGKIVLEKYFGAFTQDSSWYWASAGKTLTAFAAGIAAQKGLLDIQAPSHSY
ncbi:MAG: serine hydrolase, partial [Bacteroidia bacterium]